MASESNGRQCMVQGRIVWVSGNLFEGKLQTDMNTGAPRMNKAGEQSRQYGFGLAVPKSVLGQGGPGQPGELWTAMHEEAYTLYPSRQLPPNFAMKYKDGDGIDDKGQPFANREGYAQHVVFALTTSLPIKFFRYENGQNILINEGIKCGDHVNVQVTVKAHPAVGQAKAGLYLNPNAAQFLGYGKEIINTPSGDQIFGLQAPPVPQGASPTPLAPQTGMLIPGPQAQQGFAPPAQYQQPQASFQPPVQQAAPVQPHYGVVPQHLQPQQPMAQPQYQQQAAPMPAMPQQQYAPQGYAQPPYQPPVQQPMAQPGGFPMPAYPGMVRQ